MKDLISVNGVLCSPDDAMISVYDRGFLFGDAIYEVTRSYGKVLFAIDEHLERLFRSASSMGIDLVKTKEEWQQEMYRLCAQAKEEDVYIRLQISRGNCAFEQISLKPKNTSPINYIMYLHKLKNWDPIYYSRGIRIGVSSTLRNDKKALDPNIKSGNYLNNILSILNTEENFDDSIMLNSNSMIMEGTTFNIFMVRNGSIYTQANDANILHGITRKFIIELAEKLQIPVKYQSFSLEEARNADEIFVSSSTKEVMPVCLLDKTKFTEGGGPITNKLHKAYKEFVLVYCQKALQDHPIGW